MHIEVILTLHKGCTAVGVDGGAGPCSVSKAVRQVSNTRMACTKRTYPEALAVPLYLIPQTATGTTEPRVFFLVFDA